MQKDLATKGNVTLTSYDGKYKIQRAIAEYLHFDERLQVAKELIDDRYTPNSGNPDARIYRTKWVDC